MRLTRGRGYIYFAWPYGNLGRRLGRCASTKQKFAHLSSPSWKCLSSQLHFSARISNTREHNLACLVVFSVCFVPFHCVTDEGLNTANASFTNPDLAPFRVVRNALFWDAECACATCREWGGARRARTANEWIHADEASCQVVHYMPYIPSHMNIYNHIALHKINKQSLVP